TSEDLVQLVHLGHVNVANIYDRTDEQSIVESTPRSALETEALRIQPPPGNQDVRAPIDGCFTSGDQKRCQERTMEYLQRLARLDLISATAVDLAQAEWDSSTHGIFGQKGLTRQREQTAGDLLSKRSNHDKGRSSSKSRLVLLLPQALRNHRLFHGYWIHQVNNTDSTDMTGNGVFGSNN
ncbi:hypothetical protein Tdes44962_MAKER08027, partial [Teratosphaeria destructans]